MPPRIAGRTAELAELAALLADDRPVVVIGEAGVGKTTVLRAAATASGRSVFEGGALSTLSWMEYLPLERAFGASMRAGDPTAVATDMEARVGSGVLLLDDLHWADPATLEVVGMLAGRVGLLAGVRRGDPSADTALDRLREAGFVELALTPLSADDSARVVRELRPDLGEATVRRVVDRTGGNPLLLRELTVTGEPSPSLRLAIAARLRQLDAAGRDTFAMLALAGRPMADAELDEAGVKSLLAADLVVRVPTGVAVRHTLLAEVVIEQVPGDELRELHLRLAAVVEDEGEAARHFQLAGRPQDAFAAAMRAAAATGRPGEQAAHLAIAAECASGPEADDLRLRAAEALERTHDWDGMVRALDRIDPDNTEAQAFACLLRARGAWTAGDNEGLRRQLEQGLALVGGTGSDVEVRLLIEQSRVPIFLDVDLQEGLRATAAALDLAVRTGIDVPRAEYLRGTSMSVSNVPGAEAHLESAMAGARAVGDVSTEFLAANNLISHYESSENPSAGRVVCEDVIRRAQELGLGEWEISFAIVQTSLEFHAGEYRQVLAVAEDLLGRVRERRGHDMILETLCITLIDVGRIDEARRLGAAAEFADDYRGRIQASWVEAEAALWGGRPARAVEVCDRILAYTEDDPNLEFFRVARAWACSDLGTDPGPTAPPHPYKILEGVRPETEGIRALVAGEDARASFRQAVDSWAPYHRRGELRCLWALGEASRRAGDTRGAIEVLEQAEARLLELGMLPLLARVHRSLRAAGVRRSAPRTRTVGDLLTGRQRELLRLVGNGLTNAEIAQRLGISRHTVVSQLASAATKLGATGRTHAAALASGE
ncbi:MAG TPA: LuxR C-terminal-related transcriptional regulator [Jatrophihabitans sp.]